MDSATREGTAKFVARVGGVSSTRVIEEVPGDPCGLKMNAQPSGQRFELETDLVRDCSGNPVPDGTIVTFTETYHGRPVDRRRTAQARESRRYKCRPTTEQRSPSPAELSWEMRFAGKNDYEKVTPGGLCRALSRRRLWRLTKARSTWSPATCMGPAARKADGNSSHSRLSASLGELSGGRSSKIAPDLLDADFVGTARDKLAGAIQEQARLGCAPAIRIVRTIFKIMFYSPDGLSVQLVDNVEYDVQILDHDKVRAPGKSGLTTSSS